MNKRAESLLKGDREMRVFLIGVACLLGILVGCSDQTEDIHELKKQIDQITIERDSLLKTIEEERASHEIATNQQISDDNSMITAKDIEQYPQTLYKKITLDIDGDGEEEEIELYVNAGKMDNGQFAWDDGQNWLLVVKDGEETYPLFDDYVQLGSIDFGTTTFDGKPGIVMLKTQHADKIVQQFTYDKNEKGYRKETVYKKENVNDHFNQNASYAFFEEAYELMATAFTKKTLFILDADEPALQDSQERMAIIEPILSDVRHAQGLLEIVAELNQEMNVSLEGVIALLNEMANNPPTVEQMNQLKSIHNTFKAIETDDLIMKEENEIDPEIAEKLQELGFIVNEKRSGK